MLNNYNKNRIIKNSLLLYVRMLFTMWLNLWTTRLVLANLGVEDMGVYGVVGSIVNVFQVLTSGVGTAIQRFLTYEMGRKDNNLNGVFCSSINVIFILAILDEGRGRGRGTGGVGDHIEGLAIDFLHGFLVKLLLVHGHGLFHDFLGMGLCIPVSTGASGERPAKQSGRDD